MTAPYTVVKRHNGDTSMTAADWHARVVLEADRRVLLVGVVRGRLAKGMFGRHGSKWMAYVRNLDGTTVWTGRVDKGAGCRIVLLRARMIPCDHPSTYKTLEGSRACTQCRGTVDVRP